MASPIIDQEVAIINDPNVPLQDKVDAAAKLRQLAEDCNKALEPFKEQVRKMVLATGLSKITINGKGLSQCSVIVPTASLKLRDDLTVEGEKSALGGLFDTIYEVKLQLRKADPTFLATFPQPVQAHMAGVTDIVNNIPRVSLKILSGVEEIK